ncbi:MULTISPECIES: hypothetical protein [unclassified Microbacterium]|uniref:hypothetical protein n=1 Tax=unclassified Microbacterium TaxID=2609290 RepID=UPI000EA8AC00|nr:MULTISPECIES: hypothetical protein [unclassified Microbacterium]MBT2484360.1 hypothetical protein [Microbacterium sp. ISL-108]RKN67273.1 hypothetical protein D7252_06595 [Microbacterium sp. CGR2]
MPPAPTTTDRGILRVHSALRPGFGTEAAVYGTILVSGLVAVSSAHGETSFVVLLTVGVTVLVFWGAHVYAGTVARLSDHTEKAHGPRVGITAAFTSSVQHSLGMLTSAAVPAAFLLAGTTRVISDDAANDAALWSGVVILTFLGYVAFLRRGSSQLVRILGALGTASFGAVFVVLKALVH